MDIQQVYEEYRPWRAHNFPDATADQQLLGMIEEMGELSHHHLKMMQGIRGTPEFHKKEIFDAIGDMMIYSLGYMDLMEINPKQVSIYGPNKEDLTRSIHYLGRYMGRLCDRHLEGQKLAVTVSLGPVFTTLGDIACQQDDLSLNLALTTAWFEVRERDWIKYPGNGLPPAEVA
jgi:hypothetical protein